MTDCKACLWRLSLQIPRHPSSSCPGLILAAPHLTLLSLGWRLHIDQVGWELGGIALYSLQELPWARSAWWVSSSFRMNCQDRQALCPSAWKRGSSEMKFQFTLIFLNENWTWLFFFFPEKKKVWFPWLLKPPTFWPVFFSAHLRVPHTSRELH